MLRARSTDPDPAAINCVARRNAWQLESWAGMISFEENHRCPRELQLKERLSRSKALSECIVAIETTDKLTDPQIVAKAKEHYGIDR